MFLLDITFSHAVAYTTLILGSLDLCEIMSKIEIKIQLLYKNTQS